MSTATLPDKKREASSPADMSDLKKSRLLSFDSQQDVTDGCTINLDTDQIARIADVLKGTFENQMSSLVTSIVTGVLGGLQEQIRSQANDITSLRERVHQLEQRVDELTKQEDRSNQYSRRNCLRVSGIKESTDESIDDLVMGVISATGANVTLDEVDRTHRLGRPKPQSSGRNNASPRPRDIIIKFATYRARQKVYKLRSNLKSSDNFKRVFINEELTKQRGELYYAARMLAKQKVVNGTWTSDGMILVKDNDGNIHRCETMNELNNLKRG